MRLAFSAVVFEWRGPAPYLFVRVPEEQAALIAEVSPAVSYGWGMVPVLVRVGETELSTALWPKDGSYVVPLKVALQRAEGIGLDELIEVELRIEV